MANSLFDLGDIDGSNGFVVNGIEEGDRFGLSVSNAGDINGDGIDDIVIGAPYGGERTSIGNYNRYTTSGESYIVFGSSDIGSDGDFDLTSLDGSNGFVLDGVTADRSGISVSNAGDVNGDGIEDLIIGAPGAYDSYYNIGGAGRSYVVFGGTEIGSDGNIELNSLNGSNGFVINGIEVGDRSGRSVSNAGDINGDGFDDLIIGAPNAAGVPYYDPYGSEPLNNGESYVVFGSSDVGSDGSIELNSLNGSNGFVVEGINGDNEFSYSYDRDRFGFAVSGAGDIDRDGFDDIVIGAPGSFDSYSRSGGKGETFVIFGSNEVGSSGIIALDSLDGNNGFVLDDTSSNEYFGVSVSGGGDVNGDGFDDLFAGAALNGFGRGGYLIASGLGYVVFGSNTLGESGSIDPNALNGTNGFTLESNEFGDLLGRSVSNAGDVNGDGFEDLIIGAPAAGRYYQNYDGYTSNYTSPGSGASFIVFGDTEIGSNGVIEVDALDSSYSLILVGSNNGDEVGFSVSGAGDVNNDGIDDLIVGAPDADSDAAVRSGESYVIFGNAAPQLDLNGEAAGIDFSSTFTDSPVFLVDRDNLIVTDSNSNTLSQATVVITNPFNGDNEFLAADTSGTEITADYDTATGTLSLTGEDSLANYFQVLQTLTYDNTADVVTASDRIIEFALDDGAVFNNTSSVATTTVELETAFSGTDGQNTFTINAGEGEINITNFDGVGTGINPSETVIDEVDTLEFVGSGLTAENLILTQQASGLEITFTGVADTKVVLADFELEQLDNLPSGIGNILFDGQTEIVDSFDVFDVEQVRGRVFNRDTVTFLNDSNNVLQGFDNSEDVIDGLGGDDILLGRSGNDWLRGNDGDELLLDGGDGNDRLDGGMGNDSMFGGAGADEFVLRPGQGTDTINDFQVGFDSLELAGGLEFEDLSLSGGRGQTQISLNQTEEVLAILIGVNVDNLTISDFS